MGFSREYEFQKGWQETLICEKEFILISSDKFKYSKNKESMTKLMMERYLKQN
jgi:hypothetical protein